MCSRGPLPSHPVAADSLDDVDQAIVGLLQENCRRTMDDIGARVGLAPSSVTRRIARLERLGVIGGYTVVLGPGRASATLRAFSELQLGRKTTIGDLRKWADAVDEVASLHRTSGEADVLVAWQLDDLARLGELLDELRAKLDVRPLRTVVALETWERSPLRPAALSG